jgi:hypothetical protein
MNSEKLPLHGSASPRHVRTDSRDQADRHVTSCPPLIPIIGRFTYWGALAIIFGAAAWLRFRLPLDPIADPDTWGYLSPALRKLTGGEFGHTHWRNFVYPGFLFLLLHTFRDFRAISVAQHLLGLIAGVMLLLTWRRTRVFSPKLQVGHDIHAGLGLLATAMFLFAAEPILVEMQIRPEGVCAFLFSINLYLVVQFIVCCFMEHRPSGAVGFAAGAVLSSIVLASARPSFWFVAVVALLPIGIFFFRRDLLWEKLAIGGSAAASAALLLLPEHLLSRHDEVSQTFLPTTLFVVHADLIRDQIAEDLKRNVELPYSRSWLERVETLLSTAITQSHAANANTRRYTVLGFNPDDLRYEPGSVSEQLRRDFGNDVPALCAFYRFYYWRTWQQRPLLMLKKIALQMAVFYGPECPAYNLAKWLPLTREYKRGVTALEWPAYHKIWAAYRPAVDFADRTQRLAREALVVQQSAYIRRPLTVLARTYRPLLLGALAITTVVLFSQTYRRLLGWLTALVLFAYSYNFAACLEVAILQSLEVHRFTTIQVIFTILAQFLSMWLILEFALHFARSRSTASSGKLVGCV